MYSRAGHVHQESAQAAYVRHYSVSRAQLQGLSARNVGLSRLLIAQTSGAPTNRKNPSSIDFPVWAFPDRRQLLWDSIYAPGETNCGGRAGVPLRSLYLQVTKEEIHSPFFFSDLQRWEYTPKVEAKTNRV